MFYSFIKRQGTSWQGIRILCLLDRYAKLLRV